MKQIKRFKETELGQFLYDNFEDIAKEIEMKHNGKDLPPLKDVREVFNSRIGMKIEYKMKFEELSIFYPVEYGTVIPDEANSSKRIPISAYVFYGVLYLLAFIGFSYLCFGWFNPFK